MDIFQMNIEDLIPYENNPRINKDAVDVVAKSISDFGFKVPIIIDKNNVIVAGHTRFLASKKLNLSQVPCIVADDLTDDQIRAFRIADNKTSEFSFWDLDKLGEELKLLDDADFDMSEYGFVSESEDDEDELGDNPYTKKVKIPQYDPDGLSPEITDLVNCEKEKSLIQEIENANITDEEKEFLKIAAGRHNVFNYKLIAEYYANASKEMQLLMEKSALVIIDVDDAIANGYVKLSKTLEDLLADDEGDE